MLLPLVALVTALAQGAVAAATPPSQGAVIVVVETDLGTFENGGYFHRAVRPDTDVDAVNPSAEDRAKQKLSLRIRILKVTRKGQ